jgi:putative ABC transport system ATP-binding protein/lipoprotein-releasing system ATP-binding protein
MGLMLRPLAGQVRYDGRPVHGLSDVTRSSIRAAQVGFVFQDAVLDASRSVLDAVVEPALYAGARRGEVVGRAQGLLEELGIEIRAEHRPGEISGGQAQRVALCLALVNDPRVILADEPTGNLDRDNATAALRVLRSRRMTAARW